MLQAVTRDRYSHRKELDAAAIRSAVLLANKEQVDNNNDLQIAHSVLRRDLLDPKQEQAVVTKILGESTVVQTGRLDRLEKEVAKLRNDLALLTASVG